MNEVKLVLDIKDLQILNTCIVKAPIPYELTAPLIDKINHQINEVNVNDNNIKS